MADDSTFSRFCRSSLIIIAFLLDIVCQMQKFEEKILRRTWSLRRAVNVDPFISITTQHTGSVRALTRSCESVPALSEFLSNVN
jgi:hypothetical protein